VTPGKPVSIKVLVNRFDESGAPLEIVGQAPAGVTVEPATIRGSATTADVKVTSSLERPVAVVLIGKAEGKLLGRSHPILIDPSRKSASQEADSED
jgi:hypothetical protein